MPQQTGQSDGSGSPAYNRQLNIAIDDLHTARTQVHNFRLSYGDVPDDILIDFELAILDVYEELQPLTLVDDQVAELWEESELDRIPEHLGTVEEKEQVSTSGGRAKRETVVEVNHGDVEALLRASRSFDMIAHHLGLGPSIDSQRPRGRISDGD